MLPVVFLCFFLSGFSALVFEVSWVRELALVLGNTTQATSTVLAVFLGGLALGAYIGGKQADKLRDKTLTAYGILEICIGVVAILVTWALKTAGTLSILLLHSLPIGDLGLAIVRLVMSIAILLLPTLLMGATLPILVRYLEQSKQQARLFSFLYGMNTLGAAAGSLSACFIGFQYLGLQLTLFCAASINLSIGALAMYCGIISKQNAGDNGQAADSLASEPEPKSSSQAKDDSETDGWAKAISARKLGSIAFLTGFTALSYEVLWTRILRCYFLSLTYSFTIMISMFLLGLAAGSFIYERQVVKSGTQGNRPFLYFSVLQYLAALACAIGLPLFPWSSTTCSQLLSMVSATFPAMQSPLLQQLIYILLVSGPTILVPSIFIGILFPMIGTLAASQGKQAAEAVGKVYALNTIGCVCGSLACGLVLASTIGSMAAFKWIVALSTITGALSAIYAEQISRTVRLLLIVVPLILCIGNLSIQQTTRPPSGTTLLATGEDSNGVIRVLDVPAVEGIYLEFNGSSLASTSPPNRRYMRLLAALPLLLHKNPEKVLVGCFGTGTTAGALAIHPDVKHLDIVELSKMVINAAPIFQKTNFDVIKRKNVFVHINDVRNYLLTTESKYDVITFEPPPPIEVGVVNLYTEEFYKIASQRLNEDGFVCQWIPMHQVPKKLWMMMVVSARKVFPFVSVWLPNRKEAVLLASKHPIELDCEKMQARIDSSPEFRMSLHDVGFDSAMAILSTYIASGQALDDYIKDASPITDDHPSLEFFMPYAGKSASDLDLEGIGAGTQIKEYAAANHLAKGFNLKEFWKNWKSIHLLRECDGSPLDSHKEADRLIDSATTLLPDNKWLKYVDRHRQAAYPNFDATHGVTY